MAFLTILTGEDAGAQVSLAANREVVIGRSGSCDVVIRDSTVSRRHARIFGDAENFFIEDLGSVHGTCVDGQRVTAATQLRDGSWINVYGASLRFDVAGVAPQPAVPNDIDASNSVAMRNSFPERDMRLDLMLGIARQLGGSLNVDEILPKVLDTLFEIFPYALSGEIFLVQPDGNLVPRAFKHRREGVGDSTLMMAKRRSSEAARRAVETRAAVLTATTSSDDEGATVDDRMPHSMLCVPMIGPSGAVGGVFCLESADLARRFDSRDRELMGGIAVIVAQALEYARTHQEQLDLDSRRRQLETAHSVQGQNLPRHRPRAAGYSFGDYYRAAGEVGGDYFGYCRLPDGRIALSIADVCGNGLPATLMTAELGSEIRHCLENGASIKASMTLLNKHFCDKQTWITLVLCVLDANAHKLTVMNAGHPPPLLKVAATGEVVPLGSEKGGLPLGVDAKEAYNPIEFTLEPGGTLVFYTDGVCKACGPAGQPYGLPRLMDAIRRAPPEAGQLIDSVVRDVQAFVKTHPQNDDICLMCVHRDREGEAFDSAEIGATIGPV